jgi:hypothetical protein
MRCRCSRRPSRSVMITTWACSRRIAQPAILCTVSTSCPLPPLWRQTWPSCRPGSATATWTCRAGRWAAQRARRRPREAALAMPLRMPSAPTCQRCVGAQGQGGGGWTGGGYRNDNEALAARGPGAPSEQCSSCDLRARGVIYDVCWGVRQQHAWQLLPCRVHTARMHLAAACSDACARCASLPRGHAPTTCCCAACCAAGQVCAAAADGHEPQPHHWPG